MTLDCELSPDGTFTVAEAGRPMLTGMIIGHNEARVRFLTLACEAPAMVELLEALQSDISQMIAGAIQGYGGGSDGLLAAQSALPDVFQRADEIKAVLGRVK